METINKIIKYLQRNSIGEERFIIGDNGDMALQEYDLDYGWTNVEWFNDVDKLKKYLEEERD